ncbi:hypothetical protein NEOKW01_0068 [Nematocida sp. AWRm80]|nr:hypothetical protein NEOKW01_0068 [Nematocida sp. AWRm80]
MYTQIRNGFDTITTRYNLTVGRFFVLIASIIILLVTLFFVNAAANISSFWSPVKAYYTPLQDLGNDFFNVTDYTPDWNNTVDILLIVFCCVSGALVILNPLAIYIGLKLIFCIIFAYLLRCFTLMVTALPDSWNYGLRVTYDTYSHFGRDRGGDLIFSGHTLLICAFAHAWSSFYLLTDNYFLHVFTALVAWLYTIMVLIFIVVGRMHYTIDVLLGFYIITGVWWSTSYFATKYFEYPVCQMKFRSSSIPRMVSALGP